VTEENELTAPTTNELSIAETDRVDEEQLYADVKQMVLAARERAALYVNQELTLLYWNVGRRIQHDILGFERAPYGKQIVENLSAKLIAEFGKGYGRANLFSMIDVAKTYPNEQIIQTLSGQLTWSHLLELLRIDDPHAREFYAELTRLHHWGVRALRERIQSRGTAFGISPSPQPSPSLFPTSLLLSGGSPSSGERKGAKTRHFAGKSNVLHCPKANPSLAEG
jgi:DUF1016 N-terminal domain